MFTDIIKNLFVQPDVFMFMSFIFTKLVVRQAFELLNIQNIQEWTKWNL